MIDESTLECDEEALHAGIAQQLPVRLMLAVMPCALSRRW
jgi:hypothetical protein